MADQNGAGAGQGESGWREGGAVLSGVNEHLAFEILAQLPMDTQLSQVVKGQWLVLVPKSSVYSLSYQRFEADTPYRAIIAAANWYADYKRQLDDRSEA